MITKKTIETQKPPDKVMTFEEIKAMMLQQQKDATLPSLLYVSRKLGEVEGVISTQVDPDKALVGIQEDLNDVYDKLVEEAGIEQEPEGLRTGMGGE